MRVCIAFGAMLFAACDGPDASAPMRPSAIDDAVVTTGGEGGTAPTQEPTPCSTEPDSLTDPLAEVGTGGTTSGAGAGAEGSAPQPSGPPYGTSTQCGDAIVGRDEECDDGEGAGLDACTSDCQTRDQPVVSVAESGLADRYLGAGRHPVAGLVQGFATTYMVVGNDETSIGASLFDIWGKPQQQVIVSAGASPVDDANPVVAALPDGSYAVAWSDFDGDGSDLGVVMRRVWPDGSVGLSALANARREFSQLNPDVLWTGSQLVVAWEDYADAFNGPDLRYRTFDAELNPSSAELSLAASELPEAGVALAPFESGWAAAYREGAASGLENIVVKVGEQSFRVGPFAGGPMNDRPALVALDETHLLLVFSADPQVSGTTNVSRLRYAVIDVESETAPVVRSLDPLDDLLGSDNQVAQLSPDAVVAPGGAYLAWRSEARPGDAAGDQLWLRRLRWVSSGDESRVYAGETELLLPRTCDENLGDQRSPALLMTGLPPSGGLAVAWTDYGRSFTDGEPDVVVQYAPLREETGEPPLIFSETWSGPNGTGWSARWSSNAASGVTLSTQYQEGEFKAGSPGSALTWVNDHTARDVDITTTIRFNAARQQLGLFARRSDAQPNSYVGVTVNSGKVDTWRLYRVALDAANQPVTTIIKSMPTPLGFFESGVGLQVDRRLRFRVLTLADGSVFLGMKLWRVGATEPAGWLLESTEGPASALALQLANQVGRFGVFGSEPSANGGRMSFDDFSANFFEGSTVGDLDVVPSTAPLLLPRATATYHCTPGTPCSVADGCCATGADCEAGNACDAKSAENLGIGSHAATCVPSHCANLLMDVGEGHADCGGPDCQACTCGGVTKGTAGYCGASCRCGIGDYPCAENADCLGGLLCAADAGEPFGSAIGVEACVPPHCVNRIQDGNETAVDCGGDCGASCNSCTPTNGAAGHCRPYCPCAFGNGHCRNDDDCAAPLVCGPRGINFGLPGTTNVCVPNHCTNKVKDTALGETTIDAGGPCSNSTGMTVSQFPPLHYRKVSYALEPADFMALPTPTPQVGNVTTPVFKGFNRFIFTVVATTNVTFTFNVSNSNRPLNPSVNLTAFNWLGATLKTQALPSSNGNPNLATSVLIGRLGAGIYELELTPSDDALTYSITHDASSSIALKDGADLSAPTVAPLYFYVPAEVATAFIYAGFDATTPLHVYDQNDVEVTPLQVNSQIYAFDTQSKPGVWKATFRTNAPRAHLVNLPDVFSFDRNAVITSKIIRTGMDYGTPPAAAVTTQYFRHDNRFLFHVSSPTVRNLFTLTIENSVTIPPLDVRVQALDGTHVGVSPYSFAVGDNAIDAGFLPVGDYTIWIVDPPSSPRYKITAPAGVTLASVDGLNVGNVWLASYRNYFYVPTGTTSVRFGSPFATTIFKVYNPSGTLITGQPVALGNNVFEIQSTTPGTWSMNIQGATHIRFLNIPQVIGLAPGITAVPLASPPFGCTSNANCASGEVCGTDNGARFGRPATDDVCWLATCSSAPSGSCGSVLSLCGTCP
jgi:hypothetical protein